MENKEAKMPVVMLPLEIRNCYKELIHLMKKNHIQEISIDISCFRIPRISCLHMNQETIDALLEWQNCELY